MKKEKQVRRTGRKPGRRSKKEIEYVFNHEQVKTTNNLPVSVNFGSSEAHQQNPTTTTENYIHQLVQMEPEDQNESVKQILQAVMNNHSNKVVSTKADNNRAEVCYKSFIDIVQSTEKHSKL